MHTLLCRRRLGSGLVEGRHRTVERAGRVRLCRVRSLLILTVPELCRGGTWEAMRQASQVVDLKSYSQAFPGYEPRGRGFDSCQPHQKNKKWINGLEAHRF